jgi:hypothetical protein
MEFTAVDVADEPRISIITFQQDDVEGEKGVFSRPREVLVHVSSLATAALADNVSELCRHIGTIFRSASTAASELELQSLQVQIEISAKGEVRLVGAASAELTGGITLIFSRKESKPE